MSILGGGAIFAKKAIFEEIFIKGLGKLWEMLTRLAPGEISVQDLKGFVEAVKTGEGLPDQNIWGLIIADLELEKKEMLQRILREMLSGSEKEKETANNFIIAVTLGKPSDEGTYPGKKILEGLFKGFNNIEEAKKVVQLRFNIESIGTDAKIEGIREALESFLKKTPDFFKDLDEEVAKGIDQVTDYLAELYPETAKEKSKPVGFWQKFKNFIRQIVDLV